MFSVVRGNKDTYDNMMLQVMLGRVAVQSNQLALESGESYALQVSESSLEVFTANETAVQVFASRRSGATFAET